MTHSEQTIALATPLGMREAVVRLPGMAAARGGLLITLGGPMRQMLDQAGYRRVADVLLAAGHVVASIDLPRHGRDERADQKGLAGMAAAMAQGVDVFAELRQVAGALIDHALAQGWGAAGRVVLFGVSRGGLSALHVMAGDRRVAAASVHAPVTHLPALREFAALEGDPLVMRSSALALAPSLADRPVQVMIGRTDPRVSELRCMEFVLALHALSPRVPPELVTGPGQTHGDASFDTEAAYQAAAVFLLRQLCPLTVSH